MSPPIETSFTAPPASSMPEFGSDAMKAEFGHDWSLCTLVNQGSYGIAPKRVTEYKISAYREIDSFADHWFRVTSEDRYNKALATVAKFVGSDPKNLVFVPNITTGVNSVLKSLNYDPEHEILYTEHTYGAVQLTAVATAALHDADTLCVDVPLPIKDEDQVIELYTDIVRRNKSVKLVILDHISSPSAILHPVKKLAAALHELGVLVMVDGAHAPGQTPLNLEELGEAGVDFYSGNLHKWGLCPRSAAILWVHPKHQDKIHPLVTSANHFKSFQKQFFYQGTLDLTSYLAAAAGIDFYETSLGGWDKIFAYVDPLLDWAQGMTAEALGTERLPIPKHMQAPFMRVVAMPKVDHIRVAFDVSEKLMIDIMEKHNVMLQLSCFNGRMWSRLSANVYTNREDLVRAKDVLVETFFPNGK